MGIGYWVLEKDIQTDGTKRSWSLARCRTRRETAGKAQKTKQKDTTNASKGELTVGTRMSDGRKFL